MKYTEEELKNTITSILKEEPTLLEFFGLYDRTGHPGVIRSDGLYENKKKSGKKIRAEMHDSWREELGLDPRNIDQAIAEEQIDAAINAVRESLYDYDPSEESLYHIEEAIKEALTDPKILNMIGSVVKGDQ